MGPTWGLQDPGGPHGGPMNLATWEGEPNKFNTEVAHSLSKNIYIDIYRAYESSLLFHSFTNMYVLAKYQLISSKAMNKTSS